MSSGQSRIPTVKLSNLHLIPSWKLQSDSSVTPHPPTSFTMNTGSVEWIPNAALVGITGVKGKYTGGMASKTVPLPLALSGKPPLNAKLTVRFSLDNNSLAAMQAYEFGVKITDAAGLTYNTNLQLDNSKNPTSTVLEVASPNGGWSAPFATIPRITANEEHELIEIWSWNNGKALAQSISVDGLVSPVPTSMLISGEKLGWGLSAATACIQPNVNLTGESYNTLVTGYEIEFW